ncbi:NUDIX domain-containing protein [Cronobacter sakazakii]|uniref:NUDIX hydrolase n=2 Tax=Cronobacter sakazakii TaxID=28141 RepID=UPI000CF0805B|nr:NUDIX domain-containing protein [Cronobacter sakazakii]EIZ9495135.1 NUDIX domain-containing protein [Cronobacter sakazakii]EJC1153556.1 NUDIX domain-containing protein [Cronobacter sakazakii]EJC1183836.1 NUDIX domain-containing protein [Cronobacter sakazakii]EJC1244023.1 NUDIX domain-containing protein [Cronobacter sakazakii]EJC2074628.1 NUDIX domain-containing protein [Cronobacter sakazakii]
MRTRPASRLLIMSPDHRLLLFRFTHRDDALAGRTYWATPGGGVEDGESFQEAAIRELREETGIVRTSSGPEVAQRTFTMLLPNGETVLADERFFIIHVDHEETDFSGWTASEKRVIHDNRWWSAEALTNTTDTIYPRELLLEVMAAH